VAAEVDDPDHVEGAAGEHAGQAAPQAVAHAGSFACTSSYSALRLLW
jgi:hypothetical protein